MSRTSASVAAAIATARKPSGLGVGTAALLNLAWPFLKFAVVNGGSAGNITVTGAKTTDSLRAVIYFPISTGTVTSVSDLTSEFTISAANTINNTGGTATTSGKLLICYVSPS